VGSSALGLMVAHDIDITTLCRSLDPGPVFDFGRRLARHSRVRRLTFRKDTGRWNTHAVYPDGIYWLVEYVADPDVAWTLDLWFLLDGTTQFDLEHVKTLPGRLTPDTRAAILRIKEAVYADTSRPRGPSYAIYEAVLDHGIRTPEEYHRSRESPTAPPYGVSVCTRPAPSGRTSRAAGRIRPPGGRSPGCAPRPRPSTGRRSHHARAPPPPGPPYPPVQAACRSRLSRRTSSKFDIRHGVVSTPGDVKAAGVVACQRPPQSAA